MRHNSTTKQQQAPPPLHDISTKGGSTMNQFEKVLTADVAEQRRLLEIYEKRLKGMPAGCVSEYTSSKKTYYKLSKTETDKISGHSYIMQRNLQEDEMNLIALYGEKAYAQAGLRIVKQNLKLQEKLLEIYRPYDFYSIKASLGKFYQKSVAFSDDPLSGIAERQQKASARTIHPENLTQPTLAGFNVRSKSEALITNTLTERNIPFVYEEVLEISIPGRGEVTLHPDFVIHLPDGKKIIWEHLGMLSDDSYLSAFAEKLKLYHAAGYHIGSNLFLTTDTPEGRLDMDAVMNVIELISDYF